MFEEKEIEMDEWSGCDVHADQLETESKDESAFEYEEEYKGMNDIESYNHYINETQENKLNETVLIMLSKDPVHDFSTALRMVDEILMHAANQSKADHTPFNKFYGYSDSCNGEFACSGFILGLDTLRKSYGLTELIWTFTTPNHGKSKCDGEGHISKMIIRLGVDDLQVCYTFNEPFEKTMADFLRNKYAEFKAHRIVINMSNKPGSHCGSKEYVATWREFNSYSSYRCSSKGIQRRFLDCKCDCLVDQSIVKINELLVFGLVNGILI
jgi:hypothetical protein